MAEVAQVAWSAWNRPRTCLRMSRHSLPGDAAAGRAVQGAGDRDVSRRDDDGARCVTFFRAKGQLPVRPQA